MEKPILAVTDPIVKEGIEVCPVEIFLVWKYIQRFIRKH
jgi:hypothetical protein